MLNYSVAELRLIWLAVAFRLNKNEINTYINAFYRRLVTIFPLCCNDVTA